MSATKTQKETTVQKRKRIAEAIVTAIANIARFELEVGRLLNEVRPTFKTDDTAGFLTWSERVCGLKKAMTYRYMQAADTVARVPAVADVTGSVSTLAWAARLTDDDIAAVFGDSSVKKSPTLETVQAVAATVSEKEKAKLEKKAVSQAESDEADKVAHDKELNRVVKAISKTLPGQVLALEIDAKDRPEEMIRAAVLLGAKLVAKHGPLALPAITLALQDDQKADAEAATV